MSDHNALGAGDGPGLRLDRWREDLLTRVLWATLVLGTLVCIPSVYLALREGLYLVAVGDAVALSVLAALTLLERLGHRFRAIGFGAILFFLGCMLLLLVGPVGHAYLLGASLLTTLLLGSRAGLVTLGLNAATLGGFGAALWLWPGLTPPDWHWSLSGWTVIALNIVFINAALVVAVGAVLRTLELGLGRERQARASLQEGEAFLRMASRVSRMGAWSLALPDRLLTWSPETLALHDLEHERAPELERAFDFYLPEDRPRVRRAFDRCGGSGEPFDLELQLETARGRRRWVRLIGQPVWDTSGAITAIQGTLQDISEHKELERSLRASAARIAELAEVLEKAQEAILVLDLEGDIRFMSAEAETLFERDRESAFGTNVRALRFQEAAVLDEANAKTLRDGSWTGELIRITRAEQPRLLEARWTLLRRAGGAPHGILSINTDITERKRFEEHLLRSQRLESIGTLAGGIAHDLNNVLTPILTSITFLQENETDPEKLEDLDAMGRAARRGADMVRQLLMFARGHREGARVPVDLVGLASEVLQMVRETFPRNVVATLSTGEHVWPVRAEPTHLHQLLTNLCLNARDAMPGGGRLTLGVESVMIDDIYADMADGLRTGPHVLLRVGDTGSGMAQELLDRIFEPFFTTKAPGKGTGLGLSTCHTIARSLGGFIHVYSEIGKGTEFKVYLPADVSGECASVAADGAPAAPRGSGELVLVVDDEENVRAVTARTLERHGYRVLTAEHGAEAVTVYARHGREIAAVFTDMSMPVMDGPATIAALQAIDPEVRIIGASGLEGGRGEPRADDELHFIPKPYTAEALLQTLRRVLDAPQPPPP